MLVTRKNKGGIVMHPMIQKSVDSGFMKKEHGLYIEEAIAKGL